MTERYGIRQSKMRSGISFSVTEFMDTSQNIWEKDPELTWKGEFLP